MKCVTHALSLSGSGNCKYIYPICTGACTGTCQVIM